MPSIVLPVSVVISSARLILERSLPRNWVSGEISNFTRAPSGHCYFVLKDDKAQARCVFFRQKAAQTDFILRDGLQVEVRAIPTIYEARGDFQLSVDAIRLAGIGALFEAFARLKAKLDAQGWFEPARKRTVPLYARRVGIVTSVKAAALRDVLSTLKRRMPSLAVIVYPCAVQGKGAAEEIAAAIRVANQHQAVDVLIVCRGGGSIEDLWAFNEEIVARALLKSRIPTVSGVGHETDFTICDFVADVRAATPTAAAMLVALDHRELGARLRGAFMRVRSEALRGLEQRMQRFDHLASRLRHPAARLADQSRAVQRIAARFGLAWARRSERAYARLSTLQLRLEQAGRNPVSQIAALNAARSRVNRATHSGMQTLLQRIAGLQTALTHLNPRAVLHRGYSIVSREDGTVVQNAEQVSAGDTLNLLFECGEAVARVEQTKCLT